MAVVATSIHSSSYTFTAPRDGVIAFHRDQYHRPAVSHHNPFEAFAPHHRSSSPSRSSAASWRRSEGVAQVPPPKRQQSGQSHSHTSSTSETPSTNWRPHTFFPAVTRVDVTQKPSGPNPKIPTPFIYSVPELLRLSGSPLVGISDESQVIVYDLVAHHVWRRGPHSSTVRVGGPRSKRGTSKPRSLHSSTDDSEHSD